MSDDAILILVLMVVLEAISALHIYVLRRQREAWKADAAMWRQCATAYLLAWADDARSKVDEVRHG